MKVLSLKNIILDTGRSCPVLVCTFLWVLALGLLNSCSHLKYASVQAEYKRIQNSDPGQVNLKHMLERDTYFVVGSTTDPGHRFSDTYLAVAAYSDKFRENERVDTMFFAGAGTHFGLNLPEGSFTLRVFADRNNNQIFEPDEYAGEREITLNRKTAPQKILEKADIALHRTTNLAGTEAIEAPPRDTPEKSLFFPAGTIREMDDLLFDERVATLGMYDPASFLERGPTMFYALEEDLGYKIPVILVHGIGGTPRAFSPLLAKLDRTRYKPWFFYYPSGGDLGQLADLFYRIFFSGRVAHLGEMPVVVVAHSMGGLIVREALNSYTGSPGENRIKLFISLATPFGGHPAAAMGEEHGLIVLPSWRDVNPDSNFLRRLYHKKIPESVSHILIYAYHNPSTIKLQENSDGVVPLSSQLYPEAQRQSLSQFGFRATHTSILENQEVIDYIIDNINKIPSIFPENHLRKFDEGGYDVELSDAYSPLTKYIIRNEGQYVMAISRGELKPALDNQKEFLEMIHGEKPPATDFVREWIQFMQEYPGL